MKSIFHRKPITDLTASEMEHYLDTEVTRAFPQVAAVPPLPPLEAFRQKTIAVIERLNTEITALRNDIDTKQLRLADLERIRSAEELALNHMED